MIFNTWFKILSSYLHIISLMSVQQINIELTDSHTNKGSLSEFVCLTSDMCNYDTAETTIDIVSAVHIRTTETSMYDPPSPDPCGLTYIPKYNSLLISDPEVNVLPQYFTGNNVFKVSFLGALQETYSTIPFSYEPTGVAYNPHNDHLYYTDDDERKVFVVSPGPDGKLHTDDDIITSFSTAAFSSYDPEGITYDRIRNRLFIVDGMAEEVFIISPGDNSVFDGVSPFGDDHVTSFGVGQLDLRDPEGIEFNSNNGLLYILSGKRKLIAEMATDGGLLKYIDISNIQAIVPSGLAYAPSSADPAVWNFYLVDRGIDNSIDPSENDGKLIEISFPIGEGMKETNVYLPCLHVP
jgi:DNA-binding beta-propeller fold protein YncE